MKWIHVFRRSGRDEDFVKSLTSTVEILPITLRALSMIARDDTPSSNSRVSASVKGLSPLVCKYEYEVFNSGWNTYLMATTW